MRRHPGQCQNPVTSVDQHILELHSWCMPLASPYDYCDVLQVSTKDIQYQINLAVPVIKKQDRFGCLIHFAWCNFLKLWWVARPKMVLISFVWLYYLSHSVEINRLPMMLVLKWEVRSEKWEVSDAFIRSSFVKVKTRNVGSMKLCTGWLTRFPCRAVGAGSAGCWVLGVCDLWSVTEPPPSIMTDYNSPYLLFITLFFF